MSENALAVWIFGFVTLLTIIFSGKPDIHDAVISNLSGETLSHVILIQDKQ